MPQGQPAASTIYSCVLERQTSKICLYISAEVYRPSQNAGGLIILEKDPENNKTKQNLKTDRFLGIHEVTFSKLLFEAYF